MIKRILPCRVEIVEAETNKFEFVVRDVGPWDQYKTITNGAEQFVANLEAMGELYAGRRVFYYDSEGYRDEIVLKRGKFAGFKPGPERDRAIKKESDDAQ